ncbi:hypothetical protein SAMN00768000_2808 [Sulfobacillus thermosulfidooxidans DSM 9293]|uniref:Uncharacterized protein n=1 Tax=Sulfobacillus thermosulfidooxidans (strain DSM 9293 / VKM B-1269 / AT-1) TaxID=929705 RepID=A0A1W1WK69_SULTA|nr:hypothetical protein SAMN00768000_2808 [Sulfobacillus thermosulfidooxidans DSM 9293]
MNSHSFAPYYQPDNLVGRVKDGASRRPKTSSLDY